MSNNKETNTETSFYGRPSAGITITIALLLGILQIKGDAARMLEALGFSLGMLILPAISSLGNGFFNRKKIGGFKYSFHWFFFYSILVIFMLGGVLFALKSAI